ncbi:MAG: M23 family metallopeptidase, partial [Bdellovibrionales bacterium]|nr:M23 family metallopeptidase [Bdellovibrionales bacterium]
GQYVERGSVIAAMGRTGRATGTHLHFELRRNKVPVDPARYLP